MRQPVWFACGDTGLLLDFSGYGPGLSQVAMPATDRAGLTRKARQLGQMMREKADRGAFRGLTDIVPGLCSVLFHYDPVIITAAELKQIVSLHLEQLDLSQQTPHVYGDCQFAMRRNLPQTSGMWSAKQI